MAQPATKAKSAKGRAKASAPSKPAKGKTAPKKAAASSKPVRASQRVLEASPAATSIRGQFDLLADLESAFGMATTLQGEGYVIPHQQVIEDEQIRQIGTLLRGARTKIPFSQTWLISEATQMQRQQWAQTYLQSLVNHINKENAQEIARIQEASVRILKPELSQSAEQRVKAMKAVMNSVLTAAESTFSALRQVIAKL